MPEAPSKTCASNISQKIYYAQQLVMFTLPTSQVHKSNLILNSATMTYAGVAFQYTAVIELRDTPE